MKGIPLTEWLATDDDPIRWVIDGALPEGGIALVNAKMGAGKTTLVTNMVRWFASDEASPLGGDRAYRVEVWDLEMVKDLLKEWYRRMPSGEWQERVNVGCARGQWESVRIAAKGPESWEEVQCAEYRLNEAAAGLRERGVEILVIDPFGPMLLSCNLSENSNDDVRCLFMALEALIARAGLLALIGTQHNGHGSTRARGASAWGDCPDLALSYDGRKLTTVKTRGAEVRCGVVWDAETQLLTLTDTVAPGTAPGEDSVKLADVLGVLTSGDPFKRGEIREALGIGVNDGRRKKALAAVVDAGAQAGFIDEEPGPRNSKICRLTETGRTHLVNLLGGVGPHLLGTHSNPLGCAGPENDLPAEVPDAK